MSSQPVEPPATSGDSEELQQFRIDWKEMSTYIISWTMAVALFSGLVAFGIGWMFSKGSTFNLIVLCVVLGTVFVGAETLSLICLFRLKKEMERRAREYSRRGLVRTKSGNRIANRIALIAMAVGCATGGLVTGIYYLLGLRIIEEKLESDTKGALIVLFVAVSFIPSFVFALYDFARIVRRYLRGYLDFWKWTSSEKI